MPPRTIVVNPATPSNSLSFVVPAYVKLDVESVFAAVDASAAGDTTGLLEVADSSGAVIARKRQGEAVSGGTAAGSATWALRLADEGGGAAGGAAVQDNYLDALGVSVPAGATVDLPWVPRSGPGLLDVTTPNAPTFIAGGSYIITVDVEITNGGVPTVGRGSFLQFVVNSSNGSAGAEQFATWPTGGLTAVNSSASLPTVVLAGDGLHVTVENGQPVAMNYFLLATVVKLG